MKNENITPAQFVEKWLPDFTRRYANLQNQCQTHSNAICAADRREWYEEAFPEALAAFEAHIRQETWREACEAMRNDCAIAVQDSLCDNCYCRVINVIEDAPIPEMPKNQ